MSKSHISQVWNVMMTLDNGSEWPVWWELTKLLKRTISSNHENKQARRDATYKSQQKYDAKDHEYWRSSKIFLPELKKKEFITIID